MARTTQSFNLDGEYLTIRQTSMILNCGMSQARKLALVSGALRKWGRLTRIHKKTLLNFIEMQSTETKGD